MAGLSMREAYGLALAEYAETNPRLVALDADTASSTFSSIFAQRFPDRFFNVGIAEPCLVDAAVGLALAGLVPFANVFAALLSLRALEQVRTCVCYAQANVKLVGHYAGVSDYKDGPTHHSITDLANLRALPQLTVIVPADAVEAAAWVPLVAEHTGPVYLRISRAETLPVHAHPPVLQIGKGLQLRPGNDVTIVCCGSMVGRSLQAAKELDLLGIQVRVLELHTLKPVDAGLLTQAAEETGAFVTAEEHSIVGGLGSAVAEVLSGTCPVPLERVGIVDTFARTGLQPEAVMDAYGMGVSDVVHAVQGCIERKSKRTRREV